MISHGISFRALADVLEISAALVLAVGNLVTGVELARPPAHKPVQPRIAQPQRPFQCDSRPQPNPELRRLPPVDHQW